MRPFAALKRTVHLLLHPVVSNASLLVPSRSQRKKHFTCFHPAFRSCKSHAELFGSVLGDTPVQTGDRCKTISRRSRRLSHFFSQASTRSEARL